MFFLTALFALTFAATRTLGCKRAVSGAGPSLKCASVVHIAEALEHQNLLISFTVANVGVGPLRVGPFETNCGCSAVFTKAADGAKVELTNDVVQESAERVYYLEWRPHGRGDSSPRTQVRFRTNDPKREEAQVTFVVDRYVGGLITVPREVLLTPTPVGRSVEVTVDVRDLLAPARRVVRVEMVGLPANSAVEYQMKPFPDTPADDGTFLGNSIGTLAFRACSASPRRVSGAIRIHFEGSLGSGFTDVPVNGRFEGVFEVLPAVLTLTPRAGVWQGRFVVRTTESEVPPVVVAGLPGGASVTEVSAVAGARLRVFEVVWEPDMQCRTLAAEILLHVQRPDGYEPLMLSIQAGTAVEK